MARDFHRFHRQRCYTAPPPSGYLQSFPHSEPPFKPSLRYINPDLGYEAPHRSGRVDFSPGHTSHLDDKLVTCTPDPIRGRRHLDPGSGALSERSFRPCLKMVPGPPDNKTEEWRSSMHKVQHVDETRSDSDTNWKSTRHRPSIFTDWYLGETGHYEWKSTRKPGTYTHQAEWVPPFRQYEGKVPKRFYSIVPGVTAMAAAKAGVAGVVKKRDVPRGKKKSTIYNQFATSFDKNVHYDESKRPLGGIKRDMSAYSKSHDEEFPFITLPKTRGKKQVEGHIAAKAEGVSSLADHTKNADYNSYIFLDSS